MVFFFARLYNFIAVTEVKPGMFADFDASGRCWQTRVPSITQLLNSSFLFNGYELVVLKL